jgi:branched-subunit amino acid transport protein
MDIGTALMDMWRSVLLFVPKAVGFLLIMLVGWIVARVIRSLVLKLLQRVRFDKAVDRGGIARVFEGSKYTPSSILAALAYYAVLLFTLQLAFGLWGPNPVSSLIGGIVSWLPRAAIAIVIVVVAAAIANAVRDLISNGLSGLSYSRILANVAWAFIIGLGVIAALNQIGVATAITTPLLVATLATLGGILIVGVGGGLIRPMQERWDRVLNKVEQESSTIRDHVQANAAGRRDATKAFSEAESTVRTGAETETGQITGRRR